MEKTATTLHHLQNALHEVKLAEQASDCGWCRAHVRAVRIGLEDLVALAMLGVDLKKDERAVKLLKKIGECAERSGVIAFIAKVIHNVKGLKL